MIAVREAQSEVRSVYRSGVVGQAVSGVIWLVSAGLSTWVDQRTGVITLVLAGIFIYPLTQAVLKAFGGRASLSKENPFSGLAWQTAFIVPLSIPLIAAAASHNPDWFYPGFMIVVGAHYLPFMTLYGMPEFAVLSVLLIFAGVGLGMLGIGGFAFGGWFTAFVLFAFAGVVWVIRERAKG